MTNLLDHAHKSWVRDEIARNLDRSDGSVFRRRSIPAARFRAAPEGDGVVTGYISTWEEYPIGPQIMERIARGAFDLTRPIPILGQHDWSAGPIGVTRSAAEDGYGIRIEADLWQDDPRGRSLWRSMKAGSISSFSVGFVPREIRTIDRSDGRLEEIVAGDLIEASVVLRPANKGAVATEVRGVP